MKNKEHLLCFLGALFGLVKNPLTLLSDLNNSTDICHMQKFKTSYVNEQKNQSAVLYASDLIPYLVFCDLRVDIGLMFYIFS